MTATSAPTTLRLSSLWTWVFTTGGVAAGVGLGFALPAVGRWALGMLGELPAPVRIAMAVPPAWLVPIGAILGLLGGLWLVEQARTESLALTVADDHVELSQQGRDRFVTRDRVAAVYREDDDLVLTDPNGMRLARFDARDLSGRAVATAFRVHGYPWVEENDPHATEFIRWVDGLPGVDDKVHRLLRARRRALADDNRQEADALDEKLVDHDVDVRDRKGEQHIRVMRAG
ncbi:hypothetical protein [Nocardia transvalensis]|uniref:YqeB family protein n=1 Tax=Nocardia transvalensis TaxID=37333 RepID=UPI001892FDF6|nr:hypothetical protein [Nocardia transvalensis]MBF6331658.1 hypothetical protein [Nocardia transvalensis]